VARAADKSSIRLSLDEARRQPDWPEGLLTNALKAGRLPWRGYSKDRDIWVTNETVDQRTGQPVANWHNAQVDWEQNKAILAMADPDVGLYSVTLERISIELPMGMGDAPETVGRLLTPKEFFAALYRDNPQLPKEQPIDYARRLHSIMEAASDRLRSHWTLATVERELRGRK
jgi:hypothetical protein